ncbi:synaptic vesicle glycoprotein 2A-like [Diprion similis]|uniref:synaptic vesicle glycoprotein 2A-like n=1 Tax=Diprion similis TaxID=362088 RepID=UPI001EF97F03|nr:synaptic vesicle glycoprotein 2A-like [Diprion similis]
MENANEPQRTRRVELEEALALAGFGKFNAGLIIVCAICLTASIVETMSTGFILAAAQCDLHMTSSQKGILTGSTFTGMVTSAHTWGVIADTTGRRKVLLVSLFGAWAFSFASAFAYNFWLLAFLRLMVGLLISGSSAAVYSYLGEFSSVKFRSKSIAWACTAFPFSMLLMPGVGWGILPLDFELDILGLSFRSWRLFVLILGLPGLISFLGLLRFPESPKFLVLIGRHRDAVDILQDVYRSNGGSKTGSKYPVSEIIAPASMSMDQDVMAAKSGAVLRVLRTMWDQTVPLFMHPHGFITLLVCAMQFEIFFSFNGMYLWMPEILNQVALYNDENPGLSATICDAYAVKTPEVAVNVTAHPHHGHECHRHLDTSVFINTMTIAGVSLVVYSSVGFLVSVMKKKTIIILCQTMSGLAGIGLLFVNLTPLISTMIIVYHVISGVCLSLLTSIVVDLYPTNLRTMAVCITLVLGRTGVIAAGNLIALLIEIDCSLTMSVMACVPLTCAILCCFVPREASVVTTND